MSDKTLYKPFKSKAKNKMFSVYVRGPTGRPKLIHFGDKRYKQNTGAEARRNYLVRSAGIRDKDGHLTKDDKNTSNYWSRVYLWGA